MTIPASYSAEKSYSASPDSISLAIENALIKLRWNYDKTTSGIFKGRIGMSIWSFGEHFSIEIVEESSVRMKSVCIVPFTLTSWGKNKRNVEKFFAALDTILKS